jgi:hypothetical protein
MNPTRSPILVLSRGPAWLFLAAALLLPAVATAAGEPQTSGDERTYVVGRATIHWKLDASRLPAASRERAVRMAETFTGLGAPGAKDRRAEEPEVKVLADGKKQARVPAYLINAAFLRYGTETALVCTDQPQGPAAGAVAPPSLEGVR